MSSRASTQVSQHPVTGEGEEATFLSLRLSSISPMVPPKHSGTLHSPASSCLGAHPPVSSWPLQVHSLHLWHLLAFDISTCYGDQAGSIRSRSAEARCVPLWAALQHQGPAWGPLAHRRQNRPKMAGLEACHGRTVRAAGELLLAEASRQGAVACWATARTPRSRSGRPHAAVKSHAHGSALASLGGLLRSSQHGRGAVRDGRHRLDWLRAG